jgi:NAD(P)H dehydrogenase (quinone)
MTKIAIIYYSLYGHIAGFAESIKKGVEEGGATCDIYQVAETLSDEILGKMGAPPKKDYPMMTAEKMTEYDGFLFGISGRFGSVPAQLKVCYVFSAAPLRSHGFCCCWQASKTHTFHL